MSAPDWWLHLCRETLPRLGYWLVLVGLVLLAALCCYGVARAWFEGDVRRDLKRWLRDRRKP
jgi:hypothetical protein